MNFEQWMRTTWQRLEGRAPHQAGRDYTQAEVREALDAALATLVETLMKGDELTLVPLGILKVVATRPRRVALNLAGGQTVEIASRRTVRFSPSARLLRALNSIPARRG